MHGLFQFLSFMLQNGEWVSCKFDLQKEVAKPAQNTRGLSPEVWSLLASESHDEQRHFETGAFSDLQHAQKSHHGICFGWFICKTIGIIKNPGWIELKHLKFKIFPPFHLFHVSRFNPSPHTFFLWGGWKQTRTRTRTRIRTTTTTTITTTKKNVLFVFIQNMLLQSKGLSLQWIFLPRKTKSSASF